ncbi:Recombination protein U [Bacillus wiedmannii]|uniref:Holliday junction resolvase RecU n=1 Tax=Bacillus wiedmannii TaxID=1890302 RepID=A0A1G6US60_9BACI|nr:Recombination protein U [Bacillus wiedmannii]
MAFEMLINLANEMYQRGGVALIDKFPTPVKVLFSNFPKKVRYSMQMTSYVKTPHIILRKGI